MKKLSSFWVGSIAAVHLEFSPPVLTIPLALQPLITVLLPVSPIFFRFRMNGIHPDLQMICFNQGISNHKFSFYKCSLKKPLGNN